MARRSLKPQLNQIRAWVRQGRTDAWIAHQLEVSAAELREFRSQHDLTADEEDTSGEIDLRDEIEAEIEAATAEEEEEEVEEEEEAEAEAPSEDEGEDEVEGNGAERAGRGRQEGRQRQRRESRGGQGDREERGEQEGDGKSQARRRRRRGRRGGRGRKRPEYEATFDHGERDGYGLWLDPTIKDNPIYAQHWAGKHEVTVRIDPDQIVIRRPGPPPGPSGDDDSDE
ncbi:MAG TPA: hypothetical protein VF176_05830 [Solirubrobacterales bacterium]